MDSQTPSLGDGGLVHFSGPRLIGDVPRARLRSPNARER